MRAAKQMALAEDGRDSSALGDARRNAAAPVRGERVDHRGARPVIRRRPPARLNRVLLAEIGTGLIVLGGYALAAHFDRLSWVDGASPVFAPRAAPPAWLLWVVVLAAGAAGLACLRWATAQVTRTPLPVRWRARTPDSADRTVLTSVTVAAPVAADLETYDGVRSAAAWLSGPGRAPALHLAVVADSDADIGALRARILDHAVPRLCQALEVETIPVTMELRLREQSQDQPTGPSTRST
ncbi:alkaline shock response membrane anchor protein AmaP [Nocardia thraciensis]